MRAPARRRTSAGLVGAVVELDARRAAARGRRRSAASTSRPRRPCRPRTSGARGDATSSPSFVRSSAPVVSASRRPTGTTRDGWSTRSTTVRRPCGSLAVVTAPGGLVAAGRRRAAASRAAGRRGSPRRSRCTNVFSCPTSPLTVTRPALISSSALRREATPARASQALRRMTGIVAEPIERVVRTSAEQRRPPLYPRRSSRKEQQVRKLAFVSLAAVAVAVLVAVAATRGAGPGAAKASSHREAPLISQDPTADNTDLYAFVSPDKPDTATIIANWIPGEDPAAGPNYYTFSTSARYDIYVDRERRRQAGHHLLLPVHEPAVPVLPRPDAAALHGHEGRRTASPRRSSTGC